MARSTRRKYYKRKSGRWAPNITKIRDQIVANNVQGDFSGNAVLCQNPTQSNARVSQAYTVKNFEITFTIEGDTSAAMQGLEGITAYIMYVPQSMNVTSSYYEQHPEYILNYKYLGSPATYSQTTGAGEFQNFQPVRMKTRLARKLQTGDAIILYIHGTNATNASQTLLIDGVVRWWTKAN